MSWSASQIFAEPVPAVIEHFQAIRGLENSLFLVPHLNEMQTEEQIVDALLLGDAENIPVHRTVRRGTQLPPGGLFVVRELLSAEELKELADLAPSDITDETVCWDLLRESEPDSPSHDPLAYWDVLKEPEPSSASDDPLLDFDHIFARAPDWWINKAPPREVLQRLKSIAFQTETVVAYYHCQMWGGDVECEIGWVWDGRRQLSQFHRAVTELDENGHEVACFCTNIVGSLLLDADGSRFVTNGHVLTLLLIHFGLLLSDGYFELERCTFPWAKYRLNSPELDQPRAE